MGSRAPLAGVAGNPRALAGAAYGEAAAYGEGVGVLNGDAVAEIAETLTDLGHDTRGVDGIFGANSRAALKSFQAANGMTPDGYAGRRTYEAVMARAQ